MFRLDPASSAPDIEEAPDAFAAEAMAEAARRDSSGNADATVLEAQKEGIIRRTLLSWGGLFWSALTSLLLFALGLWFTSLVEDMFRRSQTLGYIGLALVGLLALALLVLLIRELRAIARQRHIARMHMDIAAARQADDTRAARTLMKDLMSLYGTRPDTARAREHVSALTQEIVDGRDLIDIAERELMSPLDKRVTAEIASAARRVSVVTAVSPRAIVDVAFVAAQAVRSFAALPTSTAAGRVSSVS